MRSACGASCSPSMTSTTSSPACKRTAPSSSVRWRNSRTCTASATSAAPKGSSSRWPRSSAERSPAPSRRGYVDRMKWTVVATVDVPNLGPGPGVFEESVLGMSDVLESDRGALQRQVTLTVEAADEAEARRLAEEQLVRGLGAQLSGVPQLESIRVEPDAELG